MNILIDIGHPAHVHLFKNFAKEMEKRGHKILFTCRDKEFEIYLLRLYGFKFKSFGKKYKNIIGKIFGLLEFDIKELVTGFKFKADIFLSHGSIYAAHASWALKKPHISFEDTFNMEQIRLYRPFTDVILTGDYYHRSLGKKEYQYSGYHQLAYLHPDSFIPNEKVLEILGLGYNDKYVIIRFVGWNATHDYRHNGLSLSHKVELVNELAKYVRVFISSEKQLPDDLIKYECKLPPELMHDAISYSEMLIVESGTMAAEGAILGIPTFLFIDNFNYYVLNDLTNNGLIFQLSTNELQFKKNLKLIIESLNNSNLKEEAKMKRDKLIKKKINVSEFLIEFIEQGMYKK